MLGGYSEVLSRRVLPSKLQSVDLITLLSRNEGKKLEFKRDLSSADGIMKAVVAFANIPGGVLVIDAPTTARSESPASVTCPQKRSASPT